MKRVVVLNSYESIKEALVQRSNDFAGRPHDIIPFKIVAYDNKALGTMDYSKKFVFMRKLSYKSLHLYGSGVKNIEEIMIEQVDMMCSILSKEVNKPIFIHQYLGKKR